MWFIIATFCAFFVKGLCGFANALVFTTMLGFTTDNINISPLELVLGYPSNMILSWKNRKEIQWKTVLPLSLLVIAGSLPGVFLLKTSDAGMIKVLFGVVVVGIGLEMLAREYTQTKKKNSPVLLAVIGIVSGLISGIYGIGALLAAYVGRVTDKSSAFQGNLCFVFFIENTFRIIVYSLTGVITLGIVKNALLLVPVMLLGLFVGMKSSAFLNEAVAKKLVMIVLIISGVSLIVTNL